MEWTPSTGLHGSNAYQNPNSNLYPLDPDSEVYLNQTPPTNPPWALGSQFSATSAPALPDKHGQVAQYPPPPHHGHEYFSECYNNNLSPSQGSPQTSHHTGLHQSYPPKPSAPLYPESPLKASDANSSTDSWHDQNGGVGSASPHAGKNPPSSQFETYPYMYPMKPHPPASAFDTSVPSSFTYPHPTNPLSTSSDSPTCYPPPADPSLTPPSSLTHSLPTNSSYTYPTIPPSTSSGSPTSYPPSANFSTLPPPPNCTPTVHGSQPPFPPNIQGYAPSPLNVPTGGPGVSFSGKPSSSHPLLQGDEEDFVPYEEGGDHHSDDEKHNSGYNEDVDYSHQTLEKYGENLTTRAKEGRIDPVIGRDDVVRQCIEILTRKSKCNPILIGHPGVGKTAVVESLALRIVKGDVPDPLKRCKVISVEVGNIVADTQYRGQFEKKIKELIDEATEARRTVILFFDELHRIMGAGRTEEDATDASQSLKPALARGDFLCIGATTYDEYTKYIEKDQALARRFQKVVVDPPSASEAISILRGLKTHFESHHGISIADAALIEAVKLSERYIPDRFLPDKAIDLVDEAAAKVKMGIISKPTKLDEIERAIVQLDMDRLSVSAATSPSSQDRLRQILSDLEGLRAQEANLTRKWRKEKAMAIRINSLKEKITEKKTRDSTPASVSEEKSGGDDVEEHTDVLCDSCQATPIIGPRFTHHTQDVDFCLKCFSILHIIGKVGEFTASDFKLVEPPRLTCDGCLINPISGDYYRHMKYLNNILCQRCWYKLGYSEQQLYAVMHNNLKVSKSEQKNAEGNASLEDLEAQLKAAENEWNEYQKHYKPLIRVMVTTDEILEVVSSRTGIPVTKMRASQTHQLLQLDKELHKRVIGQDEACNSIARAIQRSRAGLSDPKRPIASLMFMGPTGVGKTELAKALASHLFNSEDAMVRIDMSEYGEKASMSRLTGAAPGLLGYGDGGQLTTPVRRKPFSVVLFDEIEKAHNDIFNIFLQILDDGRLTDSEGRVVNFTNTVIIMTSNVGAERITEVTTNTNAYGSKEEAYQVMKSHVMECARERYRPEFINRIDEFIVFQPLSLQQICEIVKLQLDRVSKRLQDRLINLRVTDSAVQLLSQMGYDPRYGARPVKRAIQQNIEDPLAQGILRGEYTDGSTIVVDTEFRSLHPSQTPEPRLTFQKASW